MSQKITQMTGILARVNIQVAALVVQLFISVAFNLMGSFLPLFIETELNYPLIEATYWTGTAQFIAFSLMAASAPFWGFLCDRVGTKKILIIVLMGNTLVYFGMASSSSIMHILLFRGLQGTFGGISTVMFALVASIASPGQFKKALSYQMAAMTMGSLVGPGTGGLLASIIGYRLTFAAASIMFLSIAPIVFALSVPPATYRHSDEHRFTVSDLKIIMPDIIALIMVYACINFITPTISWFLESLGIPEGELLVFTAIVTTVNGLAFALATPFLTRVVSERTLPLLSAGAAVAIIATAFAIDPYQFIGLRIAIGAIQAGIPPNLIGGKSGRKGTAMGFLNSARFMGMAIGPLIATSLLGNGDPPQALYMLATMMSISLFASVFIYLTHTRKRSK